MSLNATSCVQPKLMEYYVQNPDEFKEKFQKSDVPEKYSNVPSMEESSQYFKFDTYFNPMHFTREDGKYMYYVSILCITFKMLWVIILFRKYTFMNIS